MKRDPVTTSGAIQADVPAVWLILAVCEISRAKPKSVIFSVLFLKLLPKIGSRIKTAKTQILQLLINYLPHIPVPYNAQV